MFQTTNQFFFAVYGHFPSVSNKKLEDSSLASPLVASAPGDSYGDSSETLQLQWDDMIWSRDVSQQET